MPQITYIEKNFIASSVNIINAANTIITEYAAQGLRLTLRQLYYQFVARDWIENTQRAYKRIGNIVNDARLAGLIDWNAIEDRTRTLRGVDTWASPAAAVQDAAENYAIDLWEGQSFRPEVWIEKDALLGVIAPVCNELRIDYFSCRGYTSQSEMWTAGERLCRYMVEGQAPVIIHLGDHDPSGLDMTRDIVERLEMFTSSMFARTVNGPVCLIRAALNEDQIEQYKPPPNPAKVTDSRFAKYQAQYGNESWELDALEPGVLGGLIRHYVAEAMDLTLWNAAVEQETAERQRLYDLSEKADI